MNLLVDQFRLKANELEKELSGLIVKIKDGYAPNDECIDHIDSSMREIKSIYESIREKAGEKHELSSKDLSIDEYYEIFEAEQLRLRTEQLQRARDMLQRFIDVQAKEPEYARAISSQQEEAKEKLEQTKSDEIPDTTVEGLFLHAMELDEIPEDINDQLDSYFIGKVTRGLSSKQYFHPTLAIEPQAESGKIFNEENGNENNETLTEEEKDTSSVGATSPDNSLDTENENQIIIEPRNVLKQIVSEPTDKSFKNTVEQTKVVFNALLKYTNQYEFIEKTWLLSKCGQTNKNDIAQSKLISKLKRLEDENYIYVYENGNQEIICRSSLLSKLLGLKSYTNIVKHLIDSKYIKGNSLPSAQSADYIVTRVKYVENYDKMTSALQNNKLFSNVEWFMPCDNGGLGLCLKNSDGIEKRMQFALYDEFSAIETHDEYGIICYSESDLCCNLLPDNEHYWMSSKGLYKWNGAAWECILGEQIDEKKENITETSNEETGTQKDGNNIDGDALEGTVELEVTTGNEDSDQEVEQSKEDRSVCSNENGNVINEENTETSETDIEYSGQEDESAEQDAHIVYEDNIEDYGLNTKSTAKDIAEAILTKKVSLNHYGLYMELVRALISEYKEEQAIDMPVDTISQAVILLKTLAEYSSAYSIDYRRLCMAVDSTANTNCYDYGNIIALFENENGDLRNLPVLKLATIIRALIAPTRTREYSLYHYAGNLSKDFGSIFNGLQILERLFILALEISEYSDNGFSPKVLQMTEDSNSASKMLSELVAKAKHLIAIPQPWNGYEILPAFLQQCFGNQSVLGVCLDIIANNGDRKLVEGFYHDTFCVEEDGNYSFSSNRMEEYFNTCWDELRRKYKKCDDLNENSHRRTFAYIQERTSVIEQWLDLTRDGGNIENNIKHLDTLKKSILSEINKITNDTSCIENAFDRAIIIRCFKAIRQRLEQGLLSVNNEFDDFLRSGYVCFDKDGYPLLNDMWIAASKFSIVESILRHVSYPILDLNVILDRIADKKYSGVYDNIGQAILICKRLNKPFDSYQDDAETAKKSAIQEVNSFKGEAELAFAYGRISEDEKEDIFEELEQSEHYFFDTQYFGTLRLFLDVLRKSITTATENRAQQLIRDIDQRLAGNPSDVYAASLNKAREYVNAPKQNFVVAEEYINRFDAGNVIDNDTVNANWENDFLEFISDDVYSELFDLCNEHVGDALSTFGCNYVKEKQKNESIGTQYRTSSEHLIKNFPSRNYSDKTACDKIYAVLKELDFDVVSVTKGNKSSQTVTTTHFVVKVNKDPQGKPDYRHPVAIMGTNLESPMDVVCLFGKLQPNTIVSTICEMNLCGTAVVFLHGALSLNDRRQIAELYHKTRSGNNPFILIDQVLILHLALKEKTSRKSAMLYCTLPFTSSFKPFLIQGLVPDEMFIGRNEELKSIMDPQGAAIVYGGRQLGKTALLDRASRLANKPQDQKYAIMLYSSDYTDDDGISDESLTRSIINKLAKDGLIVTGDVANTHQLYTSLNDMYDKGKWKRILVLIDEADDMLLKFSSMKPAYKPIIPLHELSKATQQNFKFVIAGLHNVCRVANNPNTIFGQLGQPLRITPLKAAEALQLLSWPLTYLGFEVDEEKLTSILVNTNYYPGIVHYVGYSLVENLMSHFSQHYQAAKRNPPYQLNDKQFGEILSSGNLNKLIDQRITWTLEADPKYLFLACCIAYLYKHDSDNNKGGHDIDTIALAADELKIDVISQMESDYIRNLLDEMVDMGILVRPTVDTYRLRQRRFLDTIGTSDEKIAKMVKRGKDIDQDTL